MKSSRFRLSCAVAILAAAACLVLAASCHKGDFSAFQIIPQPYIIAPSGDDAAEDVLGDELGGVPSMGLSLYVRLSVPSNDGGGLQMVVASPDGSLSWTFAPETVSYEGVEYYGSSNLMMPSGVALPIGTWSLDVLYRDGRTLNLSFDVSYRDVEGAVERSQAPEAELPFFDAPSNFTVLQSE